MRLKIIVEDISRQDFFDFYVLLLAYHDKINQNHDEIRSHLDFLATNILSDHLNQLSNIVINRLLDTTHTETSEILSKYNLSVEGHKIVGVGALPIKARAGLIAEILELKHHHGFTGDTWHSLGQTFVDLCRRIPIDLDSKILAIDKIYNLLHHGGQITDYMDERDWLEDALNTRDSASQAQLFGLASSGVRSIVGRASYAGQQRGPVSELSKLYTALRRAAARYPGTIVEYKNNKLIVSITAIETIWAAGSAFIGQSAPWVIWGDGSDESNLNKRIMSLVDNGYLTLGKELHGMLTVSENDDQLTISDTKSNIAVTKPINRQYHLATDLINAALSMSQGHGLHQGINISSIKPSYYQRNGRRIVKSVE